MTTCDPIVEPETEPTDRPTGLPEGVPPLTSFYLYLTNGCNLACRHCWITPKFVNGEPDPGDCLDLDLLKQAVAEAKPLGLRSAKLTGGEPTLHPRFVEIVDFLTAEGLSLDLETNGTLIDRALAQHLRNKTNVWFVSVSIDGSDAETHDAFRGVPGCFDAAMNGLEALAAAGYHPQVIMSVHRGNVEDIKGVIRLAVDAGAGSVKFNPVTPSGRGIAMHEQDQTLSCSELIQLAHSVRGRLQDCTPIKLILSTPLALYTVRELLRRGQQSTCNVRSVLGILGSGEMALCGIGRTVPDLCFGKLGATSVEDVWFHHPTLKQLRRDLDEKYSGICGECIHARSCLTYCVAQNYLDRGQLVAPAWLCRAAYEQGLFPLERLRSSR